MAQLQMMDHPDFSLIHEAETPDVPRKCRPKRLRAGFLKGMQEFQYAEIRIWNSDSQVFDKPQLCLESPLPNPSALVCLFCNHEHSPEKEQVFLNRAWDHMHPKLFEGTHKPAKVV
jgi:hypothetical protein